MRQARILEEVRRTGGARVAQLTALLGVSDMTVRRDLEALDRKGLLASQWRVAPAGVAPRNGQEPARTAAERLLAVILHWPILSALVLVVLVALLFTVLLNAGPPTEWFN